MIDPRASIGPPADRCLARSDARAAGVAAGAGFGAVRSRAEKNSPGVSPAFGTLR